MTVITDRTGEETNGHSRTLLTGRPGSGLSRTAAGWPDPYFLLFGGNLRFAGEGLSFTQVTSIDELLSVLQALTNQDLGAPVATAVIDTVDGMEHLVGPDARKMRSLLKAITALPLDVVLLCHVVGRGERLAPALCIPDEITEFVDVALHIDTFPMRPPLDLGLQRYAQVWPDYGRPWLMDRTGRLPQALALEDVAAAVLSAFHLLPPELQPRPVAPPSPPVPRPEPTATASAPTADLTPVPVPPAPLAEPTPREVEEEEGDEADQPLPMCTSKGAQGNECLARVESPDSYDLSMLRFRRPMCGPCGQAEYEAMPKKVARKAPAARAGGDTTPVAGSPAGGPADVSMPHGERVGRITPTSDPALRDLLNS